MIAAIIHLACVNIFACSLYVPDSLCQSEQPCARTTTEGITARGPRTTYTGTAALSGPLENEMAGLATHGRRC